MMTTNNTQDYNIEKLINSEYEHEIEKPPFAQLYNFVLNNLIEPNALAIWCYLQSKSSNWKPRKKEIENHFPSIGRDKVHKSFMILKECGLYEAIPIKEKGVIKNWKITIRSGFGREQSILKWKESFIKKITEKRNKIQITEKSFSDESHNTENQYCGDTPETHAQQGVIHNTEKPDSGESVHIRNKEFLPNKDLLLKENTTTSSSTLFEDYKQSENKKLAEINQSLTIDQKKTKFKQESLEDEKCIEVFNARFKGLNVTLSELYDDCQDYWSQKDQLVYKARFLTHLKKAPIDNYKPSSNQKITNQNETHEEALKRQYEQQQEWKRKAGII